MRVFIPMAITIQQILDRIRQGLSQQSETPALDAQVLVSHFLGKPRAWILAHPEALLSDEHLSLIDQAFERLKDGEPLPYVIGHWEFYGIDFLLSPEVLIPRPETELLVERGLEWLRLHPHRRQSLDVGTGSGCIGIALARHIPDLHVLLTDISLPALNLAQINAEKHGLFDQLEFKQADLLDGVSGQFDLICANLPYIPSSMLNALSVFGHEPTLALDGGVHGTELITKLLEQALYRLSPGGLLLIEIEASQGVFLKKYAQDLYPASLMTILRDLSGHDRCIEIRRTDLIVHLCQQDEWFEAQGSGIYKNQSLDENGFIHCSKPEQILKVANRYYRRIPGLVVLWIDPKKITSEIRWEYADGELFPHVYGPIDLKAVTAVTDLSSDANGSYLQIPSLD